MIFKSDATPGDLNGFLDQGSHLDGELRFKDTFRVDGKLTGKATSNGDLVVGERGEVNAELAVGRLFVSGVVRGTVVAEQRVEVSVGGRLQADVKTPVLVLEDGAFFEGRCSMERSQEAPKPAVVARMPAPGPGE